MKKSFFVLAALGFAIAASLAFTKVTDPGWKNLKILPKNISEKQMDSVMEHYTKSLGVNCEFCHVKKMNGTIEEWDMATDTKKHKLKAREMMRLTNEINDKYFPYGGPADSLSTDLTVTCYTCHNGHKEPLTKAVAPKGVPQLQDMLKGKQ